MLRKILAIVLSGLLVWLNSPVGFAKLTASTSLPELVKKPYLELLEIAPTVKLSQKDVDDLKKQLEREEGAEKKRLEKEEEQLKNQNEQLRKQLAELNKRSSHDTGEMQKQRRDLHCRILKLESEIKQKKIERNQGVPVAYDNKMAKLDLIQRWPAKRDEIEKTIAAGRARERQYGDVEDIGIRKVGEGQEKDIKLGEEAVRELKASGLMPPEIDNEEVKTYLLNLAELIGKNSDLKVPVRVTLLDSDEINAFSLPGGYLFVNAGLVDKAETESELVGVMAHELAHVAARHGSRLVKRATIASIFYQTAQIAALILTGGAFGIGMYYALQYGFFGLGMVLNLALLGVNREYEAEADQLGAQYAWNAGYDPRGFITFFDKMASEKGYVKSTSFFRTHPPFFDRILSTFSEIEFLSKKEELKVDSSEFHKAQERLKHMKKERKHEKGPTLKQVPECDQG